MNIVEHGEPQRERGDGQDEARATVVDRYRYTKLPAMLKSIFALLHSSTTTSHSRPMQRCLNAALLVVERFFARHAVIVRGQVK